MVSRWVQARVSHHQRLLGAQHASAQIHRRAVPPREGVSLPKGAEFRFISQKLLLRWFHSKTEVVQLICRPLK